MMHLGEGPTFSLNLFTFAIRVCLNIPMAEVNTGEVPQSTAVHEKWYQKLNPFKKHPSVAAPISPISPTSEQPMAAPTSPMTPEAPTVPATPTPVKA